MRARIAGNFPCASCTVPVHTSCSGSLPGPFRACSFRLYSLVPTPVLLADAFFRRADRRGTSERSHGGKTAYWRDGSIVRAPFSVKSIFVLFFILHRSFSPFTPSFRCPFVQLLLPLPLPLFSTNSGTPPPVTPVQLVDTFPCGPIAMAVLLDPASSLFRLYALPGAIFSWHGFPYSFCSFASLISPLLPVYPFFCVTLFVLWGERHADARRRLETALRIHAI